MAQRSHWEKALLITPLILLLHLGYRLLDQSQMIQHFPLDFANDVSSYMAQLHFLEVCGFHQPCPYWYNGFTTFQFSPPGWYFFAYPFYLVLNNVQLIAYLSIILSLIAAFFLLWHYGKSTGFSRVKRIAFFALFFANASAIGNFIRLGRVHELLSWVIFIPLFFLLYHYRNRQLNKKFLLVIPLYAALILVYHSTAVLAGFLWLGFLLTRTSWKEAGKTIATIFLAAFLAGFWLFPFIAGIFQESAAIPHLKQGSWILDFSRQHLFNNLAVFIVSLACIIAFFFWKKYSKPQKTDIRFFIPTLILAALFFLHLTPFIPVINQIFPDPVIHYLLFFAIFFFLSTHYTPRWGKFAAFAIIVIVAASILVNIFHTQPFIQPDTPREQEFLSYLPSLQERFIIMNYNQLPYNEAFYSLAAIQNKASASGWYPEEKSYTYIKRIANIEQSANTRDCPAFITELQYFNTTEILSGREFCSFLEECGLQEMTTKKETCFYKLTS